MSQLKTNEIQDEAPKPDFVTVIIVNFNAGTRLEKCLASLEKQTYRSFEIIVFDNCSTDQSISRAVTTRRSVRLINSPKNLGFAAANNRAAREAAGAWIALLNPDAYPEPGWLEALVTARNAYPDAEAFGSTQLSADRPDMLDGAGDVCSIFGVAYRGGVGAPRRISEGDWECFSPCAAAALYRKETFLSLGGFDESFFCYGEDVDFGWRLRLSGGRALQIGEAVVHHEGSGLSGRNSDFTTYHGHRNRIWLFYKNLPPSIYLLTSPLRLLADMALFFKALAQGAAPAYLRAMRDGYGGLASLSAARTSNMQRLRRSRAKILRALSWSPFRLLRRGVDLRPISQNPTRHEQQTQ